MTDAARPRRQRQPLTATQRALGLLTRREHSRKELARKLVARGLEPQEVAAAVQRLAGEGWQDDARFAEALVRSRAGAGYGPLRIRAELATHGLDADAIAAAMDGYDRQWTGNARELVQRRFGSAGFGTGSNSGWSAPGHGLVRKAADLLIRRGFTAQQVRAATRFDPED